MKLISVTSIGLLLFACNCVTAEQQNPDGVLLENGDGNFEFITDAETRTYTFDGIVEQIDWDLYEDVAYDDEDRGGVVSNEGVVLDDAEGGVPTDSITAEPIAEDPNTIPQDYLTLQKDRRQRPDCFRASIESGTRGGSANRGCRQLRGQTR
jgi:hypothetical protein